MSEKLRECGCGGNAIILSEKQKNTVIYDIYDYVAICRDCKISTRKCIDEDEATKAWNIAVSYPKHETVNFTGSNPINKDDHIKSLEQFMVLVALKFKTLPDFTDPENGNDHIFRAIDNLLTDTHHGKPNG